MIKKLFISIILNSAALYATVVLLDFVGVEGGFVTYVWAGIILGFLNGIVKPALKLITLPLKYLTLGLSLIAINAAIFYLTDFTLEAMFGLEYDIVIQNGLVSYIKVGILFGAINWLEHLIIR